MKRITQILVLMLLPLLGNGQLYYPPNNSATWDTMSAASMGYCTDSINALYDFLEQNDTKAFILLKDGKIVLEKYFGTFTIDSNWYWASAGKTLTAVLVGIAQQNNLLSINDTTSKYLGSGWTSCTQAQEDNITIRHQLSMTTGLDDGVANADCTQPNCLQYKADAGTRWAYHNGSYTLLDSVLQYATGNSINQLVNSWVKNPTGMNGIYIQQGSNKVYFSTARSMARFGLLLLSKGKWNGTAVLSDTNYYNSMVNTSQSMNPSYGYLTWLNGKSSYMVPQAQLVFPGSLNVDAPADMFAALGKNAQLLNVVPSENIVWVRMGEVPPGSGGLVSPPFNNDIWQRINRLKCTNNITALAADRLSIYPNPAADVVHVRSPKIINHIQVVNMMGTVMHNYSPMLQRYDVAVTTLPSGVYHLQITLADGVQYVERVVKY